MSANKTPNQRYYTDKKSLIRPVMSSFGYYFVTSFVFGLFAYEHMKWLGIFMLTMSVLFLLFIVFSVIATSRKLSYIELTDEGIASTQLGFKGKQKRLLKWSDIRQIEPTTAEGFQGAGVMYKSSYGPFNRGEKWWFRKTGYFGFIGAAYSDAGSSLVDDAIKRLEAYSKQHPDTKPTSVDKA
jgi:hypothetical protein